MSIVSSVIVSDQVQRDGRHAVRQRHIDNLGLLYFVDYLCTADFDVNTDMATRAIQLAADLQAQEITANVQAAINQGVPPLTFNYSTAAQALAAVRNNYALLSGWNAIRLGNYINGLGLTDNQLANAFGLISPSADLTALKSKLTTAATRYSQVIAEQGV